MSYNRDHQNDVDVLIDRHTFGRHDFLAPARHQADIVLYDTVLKLLHNGQIPTMLMTTATTLSVGLIDTNGGRADYTRDCHGLLARHRNKSIGRDDHFWACGCPDETNLLDAQHAIEELAKRYCRPIELALVQDLKHWDGAKLMPDEWGTPVGLEPHILSDRPTYTEPIEFLFMPPWILQQHYSIEEARDRVNEAIASRAKMLNDTRQQRLGTSRVLGRRGCNRLDPLGRRDGPQPARPPEFCGSERRVARAIRERREKRRFYRECLEHFRGDRKDVVFPAGTVMMRKLGAFCDPLPRSRVPVPPAQFPRPPNAPDTTVDAAAQ